MEVIDGVDAVAVEVASATVEVSETSVAGNFDPVTREAQPAGSLTPAMTSSVPDRREVAEEVEEEVEAAAVAADDRPAVAGSGSGSCHRVPAEKPVKS